MIVELIARVGDPPIRLDVAEFIVRQPNGTPIAVGADYGPEGSQAVSCVGMKDFNRMLKLLGVNETVVVSTLQMPKPQPGARLIAGPTD